MISVLLTEFYFHTYEQQHKPVEISKEGQRVSSP